MKINADVNAKNWLTKEYVIKNLIRILAVVNVNVINHVMLKYLDYKNWNCRKTLVDKLVEECGENIDEKKLHPMEIYNSSLNDYKKYIVPAQ